MTSELRAERVLSRDPFRAARVLVFVTTDTDDVPYWDWSVSMNDGRLLAQSRSEIAEGTPTMNEVRTYLDLVLHEREVA